MPTPLGIDPDSYEIYIPVPAGTAPPPTGKPTDRQPTPADQGGDQPADQPPAEQVTPPQPPATQPAPAGEPSPPAATLGPLAGLIDSKEVFLAVGDGLWHHIPDVDTFKAMGLDWRSIKWYGELPGSTGEALPSVVTGAKPADTQPTPAASLSRSQGVGTSTLSGGRGSQQYVGPLAGLPDGSVYVAGDDGLWHHVPDAGTFNAMGLDWGSIKWYGELPGSVGNEMPALQSAAVQVATPAESEIAPMSLGSAGRHPIQPTSSGTLAPRSDAGVGNTQESTRVLASVSQDEGLSKNYKYTYSLGFLGSPSGLATLARSRFGDLFSFRGGKNNFKVGDVMYLDGLLGLVGAPIKVVVITATSFTFEAIKLHPEGGWLSLPGDPRRITFSFSETKGQEFMTVSTMGSGTPLTVPPLSFGDFKFAKEMWNAFASNIATTYVWNRLVDVSPAGRTSA